MSEKANFRLKYDGPSLGSHEMDVKDFAPALLALGELLEEANSVLNNGKTKVSVNIKATNPGSVDAVLSVSWGLVQQTVSLFSSDGATAIVNAHDLLKILGIISGGGGGYIGVIGLIKWAKARKISSITKIETGDFKVELQDGEVSVRNESEIKLFSFISIRKKIESIIRTPLLKPGIDSVSFRDETGAGEQEITKEDSEYFSAPEVTKELIDDREIETHLTLVNVSFQDGKWKFNDGSQTFFAEIVDGDFNEKVRGNQITFARDDILKVILIRKQYISDGAIKTEYALKKVIDHRSAAVQMKLPFTN